MTAPTPEPPTLTEAQREWHRCALKKCIPAVHGEHYHREDVAWLIADATADLRAELEAERAKVARVEAVLDHTGYHPLKDALYVALGGDPS